MPVEDLLIFPKGYLKIANGVFVAASLICILVFDKLDPRRTRNGYVSIYQPPSEMDYFHAWIAILGVAIFLSGLMACCVAVANSSQYNICFAVFYLLDTILVSVGTGLGINTLAYLNAFVVADLKVPGYGEFVAATVFSVLAVLSRLASAILHLVSGKNVTDPMDVND